MTTSTDAPRAAVVYESMFGNTAQVAHAIAKGLESVGYAVACVDVATAERGRPMDADLLVVGAPTHAFSLSRPVTRADAVRQGAPPGRAPVGMREWLATATTAPGVTPRVAAFDTRVTKVRWLHAAAHAAARLVSRRGFERVGRPTGFLVEDTPGPVCEGELARAVRWGEILGRACLEDVTAGPRS